VCNLKKQHSENILLKRRLRMKNKSLSLFTMAGMVLLAGTLQGAHDGGFDVPWEQTPEEPTLVKKIEPVVKKPSFFDTVRGFFKKKSTTEEIVDGPRFGNGNKTGKKSSGAVTIEVAGSSDGALADPGVTAAEKAAIIRAANRGFTFFRKPILKDEPLSSNQQALFKNLIKKIEERPNYKLTAEDMKDLDPQELKLVEKIYNRAKEEARRNKKKAAQEAAKLKKEQAKLPVLQ
jgi:hypothetical protein